MPDAHDETPTLPSAAVAAVDEVLAKGKALIEEARATIAELDAVLSTEVHAIPPTSSDGGASVAS